MKQAEDHEEFDTIEAYLLNRLDKKTMADVEYRIKNDSEFAKKVKEIQHTQLFIKEAFLEQSALETIKALQQRDRDKFKKETQPRRKTVYWKKVVSFAAAASIIIISYLSLTPVEFPDTENDFHITRGLDTTNFTREQRIAFSQFFDGQAHFAEGEYLLAVRDFENAATVKNVRPYFREATQWHLALAYTKSGQALKAERIYKQFSECVDCEYPISPVNRWKLWWRIQWAKNGSLF